MELVLLSVKTLLCNFPPSFLLSRYAWELDLEVVQNWEVTIVFSLAFSYVVYAIPRGSCDMCSQSLPPPPKAQSR